MTFLKYFSEGVALRKEKLGALRKKCNLLKNPIDN